MELNPLIIKFKRVKAQNKNNMKTFHRIVESQKKKLVENLTKEEQSWILQSLVDITLNYKLSGNIGMYCHAIN